MKGEITQNLERNKSLEKVWEMDKLTGNSGANLRRKVGTLVWVVSLVLAQNVLLIIFQWKKN